MVEHVRSKIQNAIQLELFKATKSIKIAVAWFTNELLLQPLILKLHSGVLIEIIINDDKINRGGETSLDFKEFINAGGVLHWNTTKQLMHDKFCIIDDRIVIYGSYNWTNKSEYNEESITISRDENNTVVFYLNNFNRLVNAYSERTSHFDNIDNLNSSSAIRKDVFGDYTIMKENGKSGLLFKDKVVLDAKYQEINRIGDEWNNKWVVKRLNEENQLFDADTGSFVGPTFESVIYGGLKNCGGLMISGYDDFLIKKSDKFGCLNYRGDYIIGCLFDKIEHVGRKVRRSDGYYSYLVSENNKKGLYSESGKLIFPCIYEDIKPLWFGTGPMFYIVKKGKYALFETSGVRVTDFIYDSFQTLHYYVFNIWVGKENCYGLMSLDGEFLTDLIFEKEIAICYKYDDGGEDVAYIVKTRSGCGVINTKGESIISCTNNSKEQLKEYYTNQGYDVSLLNHLQ